MRIKTALAALLVPIALLTACPSQNGCFDDGEQVSCNDNDDDNDDDNDEDDD